ncbi:MAG TPA: peptide chain release factor 2 [Thermoanaerobaculia bacterium]|nr:peptide chain release factor 2 [Thermoanaerobaculia bacterium]
MIGEAQQQVERVKTRLETLRGYLDRADLERQLGEIDHRMQQPGFWDRPEDGASLLQERRALERKKQSLDRLERDAGDLDAWGELLAEGEGEAEADAELDKFLDRVSVDLDRLDLELKLAGPDDQRNAICAVHPGAGGTESQDWAEMLLRMYLRWGEQNGFEVELLDRQDGEEAGIKSATFVVRGEYAYGYLQGESGVHRLVRISPFDAQKRRHTSFASVYAYPEVDDDIEIEIEDKDLRVDTFRSSGAGGQHINVTDSAVRITHMPSGIVVSCQNERSQHKNRATAMKVLRARLYDLELRKRQDELDKREGEKKEIGFGSQIRSYVLHPYRMVKDHRTGIEVGDTDRVLDGYLAPFIEAFLKGQIGKGEVEG